MQITPSATLCSDFATALNTRLNNGGAATVKIYTGTKPVDPSTAITSQVLLGTCTCSAAHTCCYEYHFCIFYKILDFIF